jgi:DNA-binding response OmpR family regulator
MESTSLAGRSILVVEDEPLIALDIGQAFENSDAIIFRARSLSDAARLVESKALSAAVVDFGLGGHNADALCARLKERNIPFVVHSGYQRTSDECHGGIIIPKPAAPAELVTAIVKLLE